MTKKHYRTIAAAGFTIISVIFLALRLKTMNHLLMGDEAWNILALRAFLTNAVHDPFYHYFYFHPPLYMVFAALLEPFRAGFDIRLESLSLLFSYLTLVATYFLGKKIGGVRFGLFSALFLSLMPFSIAYDTCIKPDSLTSALGYLAIILFLDRKFFWCAVALSFSLLAKETALFIVIAISILMFIFMEKRPIWKLVLIYLVIFALTSWWFIYFSALPGSFKPIYFSILKDHPACQYSYLQHFKKLYVDLGMPLLIALITGLFYLGYLIFCKKQYRWSVPIVIAASVYTVTAFIILKEPWFCLAAVPALAMISAGGALWLVRRGISRAPLRVPYAVDNLILLMLIASIIYKAAAFSYNDYHAKVYPHGWPISIASRDLAAYLNKNMKDDDRLMITVDMAASPTFIFYWTPHLIQVIVGEEKTEDMIGQIIKNKISWFVDADPTDPERRLHSLGLALNGTILGEPEMAGCAHVWKTEKLWPENREK